MDIEIAPVILRFKEYLNREVREKVEKKKEEKNSDITLLLM